MIKKSIFISAMVIVLVLAFTAVATFAYFNGTDVQSANITTASIAIGKTGGFPMSFSNLLPGELAVKEFSAKNIGTREADFYLQLVGDESDSEDPNYMNFCLGSLGADAIHVWVQELDGPGGLITNTWVSGASICNLYPGHPGATIRKIGDDIGVNTRAYYKVTVKLNAAAGNEYNGKTNTDFVNLIAVQYNGPAPKPDLNSYYSKWPDDVIPDDDDPNYP